jgi:hypothetical protein
VVRDAYSYVFMVSSMKYSHGCFPGCYSECVYEYIENKHNMLETSFFLSRQCSWFQPLVFSHSFLLSSNLYASFTSFINNYLAISEYLILQYLILSSIGMSKYHFIVSWVFFQSSISYHFLYNYVNLHDLQYLNILVFSLWFSLISVSKYHFVVSWV